MTAMQKITDFDFDIAQLQRDALRYWDKYQPKRLPQICMTGPTEDSDVMLGVGNVGWNSTNKDLPANDLLANINLFDNKPKRTRDDLREEDFNVLIKDFKGDYIEEVQRQLSERYTIGRMRFMYLQTRVCFPWHRDSTMRLHIPVQTDAEKTGLIIGDELFRMPADGTVYIADTTQNHTVYNACDKLIRIHLVVVLLERPSDWQ